MKTRILVNAGFSLAFALVFVLRIALLGSAALAAPQENSTASWEHWHEGQSVEAAAPVVQNRQVSKGNRLQLLGSLGGAYRGDLYNTPMVSFSGRYHFSERHAWEIARIYAGFSTPWALNAEVISKTQYTPDVQLSRFQLVTSYVFSPIYGKYAWNDQQTVYFDIFGTAGGGVRFAQDLQPIFELGLGMNHYVFAKRLSIVPELRIRGYSEKRTRSTLVIESLAQLGVAWLW